VDGSRSMACKQDRVNKSISEKKVYTKMKCPLSSMRGGKGEQLFGTLSHVGLQSRLLPHGATSAAC